MSQVKVQGDPSGTGIFTIASPNSNSNYTLTLPTASGTFLTNSGTEAGAFSTLSVNGNNISAVNSLGFRNRIINGAMVIDQRNAGASVSKPSPQYVLDRWNCNVTSPSAATVSRSSVAPAGFTNSLFVNVTTGGTIGASINYIQQAIEGFNVADLGFGAASASTITISFWVRSSVTGTFGGSLRNGAANRSYAFTYSISAANTWEQKSLTIVGDTTGTWATDNTTGLNVFFDLGSGAATGTAGAWTAANYIGATGTQTALMTTSGATFYITGVQLEAGSVATPFERRDFGRELIMCQRYYIQITGNASNPAIGTGTQVTTTQVYAVVPLPVSMRSSSPTITGGVAVTDTFSYNTGVTTTGGVVVSNGLTFSGTMSAVGAQGRPIVLVLNGDSAYLGIATEL